MKKIKVDKSLLFLLIIEAIISIITIYSAKSILPSFKENLWIKQLIWYIIGFFLIFYIVKIKEEFIYKNINIFYFIGISSLLALLVFASPINNSKCWFQIPGIGSIQPSEFMKIILIIEEAVIINNFNKNIKKKTFKQELILLLKIGIIFLIPSILTFLEPDTGIVLIYFIITVTMLLVSGISLYWFILGFSIIGVIVALLLGFYFLNQTSFVNIFGTDFFLRMDRLLDWKSKSGYQLENGMAAIGAGGLFGKGITNTSLYFPEAHTDFIFAVYANNFGFIGSLLLFIIITLFDLKIINIALKSKKQIHKYIIAGIIGMLIYQQVQNIGMTFGLIPITGITLPFISYGGSSLLSYMLMMGLVLSFTKKKI